MENLAEKNRLVQTFLDQGNKSAAIKTLFELALQCARNNNFEEAEAIRARIYDIDSLAVSEIVRCGEIIEHEKEQAIDRRHRGIWARLYDGLSVEEANALYFSCTKATYRTGETIFEQGQWGPRLYFINSGRAGIAHFDGNGQTLLKTLERGDVAGRDAFFSFTICTTSLIARTDVELSYLDSEVLKTWKTTHPVLESKLESFTGEAENIGDVLKAMKVDRRGLKRIGLTAKASISLLGQSEKPTGTSFKVDACDLSRGGAFLMARMPNKAAAGRLLGKRVLITYFHPSKDSTKEVKINGTVVAVRLRPFGDCAVNVKFDSLWPEELINKIALVDTPVQLSS